MSPAATVTVSVQVEALQGGVVSCALGGIVVQDIVAVPLGGEVSVMIT